MSSDIDKEIIITEHRNSDKKKIEKRQKKVEKRQKRKGWGRNISSSEKIPRVLEKLLYTTKWTAASDERQR